MGNNALPENPTPFASFISHATDAPNPKFAVKRKVEYEVSCQANHIVTDLLPIGTSDLTTDTGENKRRRIFKISEEDHQSDSSEHSDKYSRGLYLKDPYFIESYSVYYIGEWKEGMPHGLGEVIFRNGSVLNSIFHKSVANCQDSLYVMGNGSYYRGNIKDNIITGKGQFKAGNGHSYSGQWENNLPHGYGVETFENGDIYEGYFVEGLKQASQSSVYRWGGGCYDKYEGCFSKNDLWGEGQLSLNNGTVVKGCNRSLRDEIVHDAVVSNSKYIYEGSLKNGRLHGKGKIQFLSNGSQYEGMFENGQMHGEGTYQDSQNQVKSGHWVAGRYVTAKKGLSDNEILDMFQKISQAADQHDTIEDVIEDLNVRIRGYSTEPIVGMELLKDLAEKYCILEFEGQLFKIEHISDFR